MISKPFPATPPHNKHFFGIKETFFWTPTYSCNFFFLHLKVSTVWGNKIKKTNVGNDDVNVRLKCDKHQRCTAAFQVVVVFAFPDEVHLTVEDFI